MIFLSIPQRIFVYQFPVLSIPLKNGSPATMNERYHKHFNLTHSFAQIYLWIVDFVQWSWCIQHSRAQCRALEALVVLSCKLMSHNRQIFGRTTPGRSRLLKSDVAEANCSATHTNRSICLHSLDSTMSRENRHHQWSFVATFLQKRWFFRVG